MYGTPQETAWFYGNATDDGTHDDVAMYGPGSEPGPHGSMPETRVALIIVILSLAALWFMGASIFSGSNHS